MNVYTVYQPVTAGSLQCALRPLAWTARAWPGFACVCLQCLTDCSPFEARLQNRGTRSFSLLQAPDMHRRPLALFVVWHGR